MAPEDDDESGRRHRRESLDGQAPSPSCSAAARSDGVPGGFRRGTVADPLGRSAGQSRGTLRSARSSVPGSSETLRSAVSRCNDAIATGTARRRDSGMAAALRFSQMGLLSQGSQRRLTASFRIDASDDWSSSLESVDSCARASVPGGGGEAAEAVENEREVPALVRPSAHNEAGDGPASEQLESGWTTEGERDEAFPDAAAARGPAPAASLSPPEVESAPGERGDGRGDGRRARRKTGPRGIEAARARAPTSAGTPPPTLEITLDSAASAPKKIDGRGGEKRRPRRKTGLPLPPAVPGEDETAPAMDITVGGPEQEPAPDILTEGQHYLSIAMLVYMYSGLRETCRMGNARVTLEEVDVNHGGGGNDGGEVRYLDHTKSPGGIIRIVIDMLEDWQRQRGAAAGGGETRDRRGLMECKAAQEYENSMMNEFIQWIEESKVPQMDASTAATIDNLRRQAAKRRWGRIKNRIRVMGALRRLSNISLRGSATGGLMVGSMTGSMTQDPNTAQMVHHLKRQIARYRWQRAISKVTIALKLSHPRQPRWDPSATSEGVNNGNAFVDMKSVTDQACENKQKFFRGGSVMNNLIESGIEVVWFSDLTQNDVVYGICCQHAERRVTVVFRGSVSSHNWLINLKYGTSALPNPVAERYPRWTETVDLHTGFSLYMLRQRRDTQMNKIEEIFEKVDQIGREMAPGGDYKLSITGHSMGGALANLLGFYAAASEKFANVRQVQVYTFASPRAGTASFLRAYQHLERRGKLRHARFSCAHDLVPTVPFCDFDGFKFWRWKWYKHVGMRVHFGDGPLTKRRLRHALDVTYPLRDDWLSVIRRACLNNILVNLSTLASVKRNHTLTEYQKRLNFTSQYRCALGKSILFHDAKRRHLKSLGEYYCIRANITTESAAVDRLVPLSSGSNRKTALVSLAVVCLLILWSALHMAIPDYLSGNDNKPRTFVNHNTWNSNEHRSLTKQRYKGNQPTLFADNESSQPFLASSSLPKYDREDREFEPISRVADYNEVSLGRVSRQEGETLPLTGAVNVPPPIEAQVLDGALGRKHSLGRKIHQIAQSRARASIIKQRSTIMDVLQEIQKRGSIQAMAFDRAAEKLRAFASHHVH